MTSVSANNILICWQNYVDPFFPATTLSASSAASASLGVNNLIDYRPSVVWQTTGCTAEYVVADFGSVGPVAIVILWNHNWTVLSQIRIRGYLTPSDLMPVSPILSGTAAGSFAIANATYDVFILDSTGTSWNTTVVGGGSLTIAGTGITAWAAFATGVLTADQMAMYSTSAIANPATAATNAPLYDSGLIDGWTPTSGLGNGPLGGDALNGLGGYPNLTAFANYRAFRVVILPSVLQIRYLRVDILDPTNAAGYLTLGRLYAGPVFQPAFNPVYGYQIDEIDLSTQIRTDSGSLRKVVRPKFRRATYNWDYLPATEVSSTWVNLQRVIGTSHDIFVILMPYGTLVDIYQTTLYGIPSDNGKLSNNFFQQYQTQMVLEELT